MRKCVNSWESVPKVEEVWESVPKHEKECWSMRKCVKSWESVPNLDLQYKCYAIFSWAVKNSVAFF